MTRLPMALMTDDEVAGLGLWPDAGFGLLESAQGRLPLAAMDVDARVVGVVAAIDVAQTFVNTTGAPIEATYIFPLPDRAAVHRFQMTVAGRVIEGVIDERGAARAAYDRAIEAGHRAAITEEDRAGVFSLRVGNLMPGEAATVRLSIVGMLAVDDGEVTFRFPLVVAPRYMPGAPIGGEQAGLGAAFDTTLVPDASRISPPVRLPGCGNPVRLGLRVALHDGVVRDVTASLHAVSERKQDAQVIEVQPGEKLDRDFILRWRIADGAALASSLVCCDDAGGQTGTFALTVVPPSTRAIAAKPRDVVFVLDRSGSMAGWKMVAARRAVARMVDSLTSRDRFAAIAFDNTVEAISSASLVEATDRQRFRAVEAIAKIGARGGTELSQPLRMALAMLLGGGDDRERMIVLVTDGQVGNEDHLIRELASLLRNVKMFTLGIDQAVNAAFLRRLAELGGGLCELVESEDRLDAVMTKVHQRIATPIATELAVGAAAGFELDRASVTPTKLPDVYAGAPVVIFGRYRGKHAPGAAISVEGTSLGDPLHEMVVARALPSAPLGGASWLAASWARARIRDLEDRYAAQASEAIEHDIVKTSKQFSVLSRFTAFVAIDRSEVVNAGGRVNSILQPVEQPAGWGAAELAASLTTAVAANMPRGGMMFGGPPPGQGSYKTRGGNPFATASVAAGGVPQAGAPYGGPPAPAQPVTIAEVNPGGFGRGGDMDADDDLVEMMERSAPPPLSRARSVPAPAPMAAPRAPAKSVELTEQAGPPAVLSERAEPADAAFRRALHEIAELLADAAQRQEATALRVLRQRLTQWTEDVRAAGHATLADTAAVQLAVINDALRASPIDLAALTGAARALATLAIGATPAGEPPPGRRSWKFWK